MMQENNLQHQQVQETFPEAPTKSEAEKIIEVLDEYITETGTHLTIQELIDKHRWELLEIEDTVIGIVSLSIKTSIKRGDTAYIDILYLRRPFRPDDIAQKVYIDLLTILKDKGFSRYEIDLPQSLSLQFKKLTGTYPKEYRYWGRVPYVLHNLNEK